MACVLTRDGDALIKALDAPAVSESLRRVPLWAIVNDLAELLPGGVDETVHAAARVEADGKVDGARFLRRGRLQRVGRHGVLALGGRILLLMDDRIVLITDGC